MKTPPGLRNFVVSALVSPTWLAIASLMLVVPLHRLVTPYWPAPIYEFLSPDGRVLLHDEPEGPGRPAGMLRSRPMNAARIEFANGRFELGYVVAIRYPEQTPVAPPGGMVWQPVGAGCEIGVRAPADPVEWIACREIVEVSMPNRMRFGAKFRLALQQSVPFWRIQP